MVSSVIYRLVSFADYTNLNFNTEAPSLIKKKFGEQYVISPVPEPSLPGAIYYGISLSSQDNNLPIITIGSTRIEIALASNKKSGFDIEELGIVKREMVSTICKIYDCFEDRIQDANRLAWLSNYAYFEIDSDSMNSFRKKFLKPLIYYGDKSTTEFVAKYAGLDCVRVDGKEEKLNVLSTIYRWFPSQGAKGFNSVVDGYGVELDINTVVENKKNRFSTNSFNDFVVAADSIKTKIVGEIFNECI